MLAIKHLAHDLPAATHKLLAVTNLLTARIAPEEGNRQTGITQPNDRLQRILAEALVHL